MGASNYVHLEGCDVIRLSESAVLVEYDGAQHWLPKSHITGWDVLAEGDTDVTVSVTEWLANKEGLN